MQRLRISMQDSVRKEYMDGACMREPGDGVPTYICWVSRRLDTPRPRLA